MFFAFLYVFSCCFLGFEIMAFLLGHVLDISTIIAIGSTFGIILCSWISYLSNLYIQFSFTFGFLQTICYFSLAYIIHLFRRKRKFKMMLLLPFWFGSVLIPSLFLFWFFYYGLLYNERFTRGASFGDLPFHLNLISSFAVGCNSHRKSVFDLVSPFFAKEKLAYPFMSNYFSAILRGCFHTSFHTALVLPSTIFGFAIFAVLSRIVLIFSHNYVACIFAPWLFLFIGGLGFIQFIIYPGLRNRFYTDFVHLWGNQEGSYFQTLVHVLLPQRASLHSLPIAYSILLLLMIGYKFKKIDVKLYTAIGFLIASLPQIQPHSIIAVAEYGVTFFILHFFPFSFRKCKVMIINYFILAFFAIVFGLPQCLPFLDRTTSHNFMRIRPIWKEDKTHHFFGMWYRSLGTLFAMSVFHAPSIMNMRQLKMYLPAFAVFALSNYIWYQPWHLDNTKVFNASWIPLVLAGVSNYLSRLFRLGKFGKVLCILLLITSCFSGFLGVRMAYNEQYAEWNDNSHLAVASFIINNTDPKAIFITDSWHANPVTTIAGRQTVSGYAGWLVSHGLKSSSRDFMIRNICISPDQTDEVDQFGVDYICAKAKSLNPIVFHPRESPKWKRIYNMGEYQIFKRMR